MDWRKKCVVVNFTFFSSWIQCLTWTCGDKFRENNLFSKLKNHSSNQFHEKIFLTHKKHFVRSIASIFRTENAEDDDFTEFFLSLSPLINSTIKSGSFKIGGKSEITFLSRFRMTMDIVGNTAQQRSFYREIHLIYEGCSSSIVTSSSDIA